MKKEISNVNQKEMESKTEKTNTIALNVFDDFKDEAPILPQEPDDDDAYDLQKELEAKFDELFGPIDDD